MLNCYLSETEAIITSEIFIRVVNIKSTTLSDHIEVLASMKHFLLMFGQENWHHLFSIGEPFGPILVIQVSLDILFLASLVLLYDKFREGVI